MELTTVWFCLIAVLWIGYFVLEGFDFGVGMLLPVLGRTETERRVVINTIGPVWDGNEVWLLVAGGATFAAFPEWYASLFSGFFLPLLLILLALIVRGVAFEYRHKRDSARWRRGWDLAIIIGSLVPAVLWGVAFANIVRGVKLDQDHILRGSLLDLLGPYALLGGATTLTLFLTHGAMFLALKTTGDIQRRARRLSERLGLAAAAAAVAFLGWTFAQHGNLASLALSAFAAIALLGGLAASRLERDGWAFAGTFAAIALAVAALFTGLFPDVLPSTLDDAWSLTTANAASTAYTLRIMTIVAVIFTPLVVMYQIWSYWVFRKRIGVQHIPRSGHSPSSGHSGADAAPRAPMVGR
jgi:cytochrome d ubiquinol oxidase subunit II